MKEPTPKPPASTEPVINPEVYHPDGAFDDPLHEWWKKNGRSIITGAGLAIVATVVVFGFRAYRSVQEEAVQVAYNQAIATGTLPAFAEANAGHPLVGVASLQIANSAFAAGEWDRAIEFYAGATDALKKNPLSGKARLGLAIAHSKLGQNAESRQILAALGDDESAFPASRSEAMYFLALLSIAEGDQAAFDEWNEKLAKIDRTGAWQQKLSYYSERVEIPVSEPIATEKTADQMLTAPSAEEASAQEAASEEAPAEDAAPE